MTLPTTPSPATQPAPASATPPESTPAQPAATPEQPAEQPKYVTQEALDAALEKTFRRLQQSSKDRTQKIETEVKAITARLEKAGQPVSPEIAQSLRQQVEAELDTQEQPSQPAAASPQTPASAPGAGDPVYDWTKAAYEALGTEIKTTDPEFKLIQAALDDPAGNMIKYQETVLGAIKAKQVRTASQTSTADARVLGGDGQPSGQAAPRTAHEAWEQAYKSK